MRLRTLTLVAVCLLSGSDPSGACSKTEFNQFTAALIDPAVVTGPVDATECDIGVYLTRGSGTVINANAFQGRPYGVVVDGNINNATENLLNSLVPGILGLPPGSVETGIYCHANLTGKRAEGSPATARRDGPVRLERCDGTAPPAGMFDRGPDLCGCPVHSGTPARKQHSSGGSAPRDRHFHGEGRGYLRPGHNPGHAQRAG